MADVIQALQALAPKLGLKFYDMCPSTDAQVHGHQQKHIGHVNHESIMSEESPPAGSGSGADNETAPPGGFSLAKMSMRAQFRQIYANTAVYVTTGGTNFFFTSKFLPTSATVIVFPHCTSLSLDCWVWTAPFPSRRSPRVIPYPVTRDEFPVFDAEFYNGTLEFKHIHAERDGIVLELWSIHDFAQNMFNLLCRGILCIGLVRCFVLVVLCRSRS